MNWRGWRTRRHWSGVSNRPTAPASGDEPTTAGAVSPGSAAVRPDVFTGERRAERDVARLLGDDPSGTDKDPVAITPGRQLNQRSPFIFGLLAVLGGLVAYGIVLTVLKLSPVIVYLVVALFIALGLEPIVGRLVRAGLSRSQAVLVVLFGVAAIGAMLIWLIVPPIIDQITLLIQQAPGYINDIRHTGWIEQINSRWHISDQVLADIQKNMNQKTFTTIFGGILGAGEAFASGALAVLTVVVLTLYFVGALPHVKGTVYKLVPQSRRPRVVYLSEEILHRAGGYLLGQVCVAVVNAVLSYVVMVALGLPFPAVLAAMVGLLALIPIVGTLTGGLIITLVALSGGWWTMLIVLAYYIGYHLVETYVITPRIMKRAVDVPPVITIVAVLAGGTLLGILGALLAVPVAAGLLLLYHQVAVPHQQQH